MQLCQSSCWLRVALSRIRAVAVAGRHLAHETCGRWAVSGAVSSLSDRGLCLNIWWQLDPRDKIQWNLNQSTIIFIHQNAFENMVCKMAAILSQYQCVKSSWLWWMLNSLIPDAGGKNSEFINHGFGKPGYHRALSHRPLTSTGNTRLKLAWPFSVTLHWKHDERFIWSISCVIASHVSRVRDCCFQTCLWGKISYFLFKASHSLMELVANELFFNEMKMCFIKKTYSSSLSDHSLCYTELSVWRIYIYIYAPQKYAIMPACRNLEPHFSSIRIKLI